MTAPFPPELFRARRDEVRRRMRAMAGPSVLVLASQPLALRNGDVEHPYRAEADLFWLTGFAEPECVAVFSTEGEQPFTLFVRPRDKEKEVWNGRRAGCEGARARFGADQAFPIEALDAEFPKLVQERTLFYRLGLFAEFDARVSRTIAGLRARARTGVKFPFRLEDPSRILHELRLLKGPEELAALRRAVELTRRGHAAAMAHGRPGSQEYELQALLEREYRFGGGQGWGYPPIVASGANATILHYNENSGPVREGDLVLIDSGAEVDLYTADVTRTFPASGRFTPAQAALYDEVLAAADACIARARPGETIDALHEVAVRVLTEGMCGLGLLQGDPEARIADSSFRRYYMHRTSHWLGLDVHDAGSYRNADESPRALAPGMVFTVEPGLYVAEDDPQAPPELRGAGVRIEDDLLVTEAGAENLTREIPRARADVERACAR